MYVYVHNEFSKYGYVYVRNQFSKYGYMYVLTNLVSTGIWMCVTNFYWGNRRTKQIDNVFIEATTISSIEIETTLL